MNKTWTAYEDSVLSNTSLLYDMIHQKFLPHRSKKSIWSRASKLGYVRDAGLIRKINSENQRKDSWTKPLEDEEFCSIIDGELLGDGCIYRKKVKNRKCYEYTFIGGSVCKEYAKYVHGKISTKIESKAKIKPIEPDLNKKSGFIASKTFYSYRFSNVVFSEFYDRWYPKGSIKTMTPRDLKLNPTICLHWHLGDGSLCGKSITLHTDNFIENSVIFLAKSLKKTIGVTPKISKVKNKYYVIRLRNKDTKTFLNYIGESPILDMSYRWITNGK